MTPSEKDTGRPTVVVTGASRGIGAAVARALGDDHALVLVGRDRGALDEVAAGLPDATVVVADLTENEIPSALTDLTEIAGLVHCAGVAEPGRLADPDPALWRRAFEINVLAVVTLTAALLPALRAAGGHVVVVNSGAGRAAKPDRGAYSASKFAARAVADTLRAEEPELRVTSIYPGRVDTDMQRALVAADGDEYRPERYLAPESVAAAVRAALESGPDAHPTDVVLRPRHG